MGARLTREQRQMASPASDTTSGDVIRGDLHQAPGSPIALPCSSEGSAGCRGSPPPAVSGRKSGASVSVPPEAEAAHTWQPDSGPDPTIKLMSSPPASGRQKTVTMEPEAGG